MFETLPDLHLEDESLGNEGIPSKVFFNHFAAIALHLREQPERWDVSAVPFFRKKIKQNKDVPMSRIHELLHNAWSTEYLLRHHLARQPEDYLRVSLHWAFPQAYYSIYLSIFAFYLAKNIHCKSHEATMRQFAGMVKNKVYPEALSFYADGEMKNFEYHNLGKRVRSSRNPLAEVQDPDEARAQIATFLKTTREKEAEAVRHERQQHTRSAIKNAKGEPLKRFQAEHWKQITDRIGPTTCLDLLYRLRIKANYSCVSAFLHADTDLRSFYQHLCEIIEYFNFVHEAYLAKAIGSYNFEIILKKFPLTGNRGSFLLKRYEERIKPCF